MFLCFAHTVDVDEALIGSILTLGHLLREQVELFELQLVKFVIRGSRTEVR